MNMAFVCNSKMKQYTKHIQILAVCRQGQFNPTWYFSGFAKLESEKKSKLPNFILYIYFLGLQVILI